MYFSIFIFYLKIAGLYWCVSNVVFKVGNFACSVFWQGDYKQIEFRFGSVFFDIF